MEEILQRPRTVVFLGTPFHDVTMGETIDWIGEMVRRGRPGYLVTANLDFAAQGAGDVELQRILVEAELVLCDGTPLVWASRLAGAPLRERVAGSDLVPALAERAARTGWRIFLLGGEESSLVGARAALEARYPGIAVAGTYSPPFAKFHEMDHADIVRRVREAKPDILLVAFGCPKQEKWIYAHHKELGVPVSVGVGATIDFLAGKVSRAPDWIGRIGLEWVYRCAQEPRRLAGRYARDIAFLVNQFARERRAIFSPRKPAAPPANASDSVRGGAFELVFWKGSLVAGHTADFPKPAFDRPFAVDLSGLTEMDGCGLGYLLDIQWLAWRHGVRCCFVAPSAAAAGVLEATRIDRLLPLAAGVLEAGAMLEKSGDEAILAPIGDGGTVLIAMPEQVVLASLEKLSALLANEWENNPRAKVLRMEFAATRFMDSSGLGFLLKCRKAVAAREGARMEILHLPPNVRNVISIAKLEPLFGL